MMHTRFSFFRLFFLAFLSCHWACDGCGSGGGEVVVEKLIPQNASAAIVTAPLGETMGSLRAFVEKLTKKGGGATLQQFRDGFKGKYTVDPFDDKSLDSVGIDVKRGIGTFYPQTSSAAIVAVGVSDKKVFSEYIKTLLKKAEGIDSIEPKKIEGFSIHTAGRPFGDELAPTLLWSFIPGWALFTVPSGQDALVTHLEFLSQKQRMSLLDDSTFQKFKKKVNGTSVRVFARGSAAERLIPNAAEVSDGAMVGLDLGAGGIALDAFLHGKDFKWNDSVSAEPPADLAQWVPVNSMLTLLSRFASAEGVNVLGKHPTLAPRMKSVFEPLVAQTGLDFENEVLPLLEGSIAVGVDVTNLKALMARARSLRSLPALLGAVGVSMVAKLKDKAAMEVLLDKSAATLGERGLKLEKTEQSFGGENATLFEAKGIRVAIGWAVWRNYYIYAAGKDRLQETLRFLAEDRKENSVAANLAASPIAKLSTEAKTTVLLLRPSELAEVLGGAPGGLAGLGGILDVATSILKSIGDIGLALQVESDGVRLRLREKIVE